MTAQIPSFTKADVQRLIDNRSFSRGQTYAKKGAIVNPLVLGNRLQAQCYGSSPVPYRVSADFDKRGLSESFCSCPVGGGGRCKHVAALLLTWLQDSKQFTQTVPLEENLQQRDKAQLIDLIKRMIGRYPDLEDMVALTPSKPSKLNPDLIRKQVQSAISHGDYGHDYYGAAANISNELIQVSSQAETFIASDNWETAAQLYATVLDEVLSSYDEIYDHDGDLGYAIDDCVQGLERCLKHIKRSADREAIFRALFNLYEKDILLGGYGLSDDIPDRLLTLADQDFYPIIAQWVREAIEKNRGRSYGEWAQQALGGLLLTLTADDMSDEEYVQMAVENGRLADAIDRLLELKSVTDALGVAKKAGDYALLQLADIFVSAGYSKQIISLMVERTHTSSDKRLEHWLQKQAEQSRDWSLALRYCKVRFEERPSLYLYQELRELAQKASRWEAERNAILTNLEAKQDFGFLVDIFVDEEEPTLALAYLVRLNDTPNRFGHKSFDSRRAVMVAKSAETAHPHETIALYQQVAEKLIAQRGRENYAQASQYLQRVKAIYTQLDETVQWKKLVTKLRTENKALRAMKDEFNRAGL